MQIIVRDTAANQPRTARRLGLRLGAAALVAAVLLGVFSLYARPDFLVALADQMWSCF